MLKTEDLNTMISIDEIHFADWQIWPQLRILLHRGKPVRISARAFDVLVVLVSARGKAVSKESLLTQVWGNEIVEENNLQAQISAIRRILGHDRHLLVTEFGCGYRFNINKSPTEPLSKEGANKQVISSQADSLIKISRIWADFFPANNRISLFRLFFPPFLALFPVFTEISPTDVSFGPPETGWPG
ncbi:winged helix-turn-helix domain-containing protein [Klebsiella pneumoniae]|uniref:winged helix-turn-helix domain-containing protein n=1 Tax=Klebsiella pneumoniae TaxID=573 RepID=UPI003BA27456